MKKITSLKPILPWRRRAREKALASAVEIYYQSRVAGKAHHRIRAAMVAADSFGARAANALNGLNASANLLRSKGQGPDESSAPVS